MRLDRHTVIYRLTGRVALNEAMSEQVRSPRRLAEPVAARFGKGWRHMKQLCRSALCKNCDHVSRVTRENCQLPSRALAFGPFLRRSRWHGSRLPVSRGHALDDLRTATSRAESALPDCARSLRDLSHTSRKPARRGGTPSLRRAGVPGLSCNVAGWRAGLHGFTVTTARLDRLVPFSCKSRAVCPSCGGRRMAERAAHLLDHVFPDVPVRQWVLSLPYRLRYQLAWNHDVVPRRRRRVRPRRA